MSLFAQPYQYISGLRSHSMLLKEQYCDQGHEYVLMYRLLSVLLVLMLLMLLGTSVQLCGTTSLL